MSATVLSPHVHGQSQGVSGGHETLVNNADGTLVHGHLGGDDTLARAGHVPPGGVRGALCGTHEAHHGLGAQRRCDGAGGVGGSHVAHGAQARF